MKAVILTRTDAARNLYRFYRLDVQRDLFGHWCCVREWGRIGSGGGQTRMDAYPTEPQAEAALVKQWRAKERRGYISQ